MKNIVHIPQLITLCLVVTSFTAQAKISDEIKALSVPIPFRDASMIEGAVALRSAVVGGVCRQKDAKAYVCSQAR